MEAIPNGLPLPERSANIPGISPDDSTPWDLRQQDSDADHELTALYLAELADWRR